MLIGQACCEGLTILSANQPFQRYEVGLINQVERVSGILERSLRGRRGYDFERPADEKRLTRIMTENATLSDTMCCRDARRFALFSLA